MAQSLSLPRKEALAVFGRTENYDPADSGSHWKRTINLFNGNVGIGPSLTAPAERLEVEGTVIATGIQVNGDIMATGDVRLTGADCAEEFEIEGQAPDPGTVLIIKDGICLPGRNSTT